VETQLKEASVSWLRSVIRRDRRRNRAAVAFCGAVILMALLGGCHVYQPMLAPSPELGGRYRFTLTDAGRAAVAERVGPGALSIEGQLVQAGPEEFSVRVYEVRTITDGRATWSGESLAVRRDHVANLTQRQFSRGRTVLAVGGVVAAVIAFAVTRRLIGAGSDPDDTDPNDPPLN
jgi:hypothetical protein